jgi:hypothetical protein
MGMFGKGFGQRLLNGIDAMTQRYGEIQGWPGAMANLQAQRIAAQQGLEFQRQAALKQYEIEHPQPTEIMKEAQSMGLQPGTASWNNYLHDWRMKQPMIVMGSPEMGQTVLDPTQMRGAAAPAQQMPKVGDVMDGHVFLGGDPSNPASWKAQ